MKRSEITFAIMQVVLDFFALLLAGFLAYSIRFSGFFLSFRPAVSLIPWPIYAKLSFIFTLLWLVISAFSGLYPIGKPRKFSDEFIRVIAACSTGFVVITIFLFIARDVLSSRFIVLAAWGLGIVSIAVSHAMVRVIRWCAFRAGIGIHRVVLIGDESTKESFRTFFGTKSSAYRLVQFYKNFTSEVAIELTELVNLNQVDEIFFINPSADNVELVWVKEFSDLHHLGFRYAADPFLISHRNLAFGTIAGIPIVELNKSRLDGWGRVFKRIFDFVVAAVLFIILSPVCIIISILVAMTSVGPIIFRNERIGEEGKKFDLFKFRSMQSEYSIGKQFANQNKALELEERLIRERGIKSGPVYKIAHDPRVTPFGRLLRRWSLDELPQLWNVLRGEISLVGPRPHQPREVEKYTLHARKVLNTKPGITGMAQISGRSNLSFEEEVRLDTYYIENWSPWLDLYILCKTPFVVLSKKGAY